MKPDIKPEPNFERLRRALRREGPVDRVPMLELKADDEIIAAVMGVDYTPPRDKIEKERFTRLMVQFWHELGYDAVRLKAGLDLPRSRLAAEDTTEALKRAHREWQSESDGPIAGWEDFERYPWPRAEDADFSQIEFAARILPEGMKLLVSPYGMLEPAMWLMGYQPFALALYDRPDLVEAIVDRIASIYVPIAEAVLEMDAVAGLFTGDDMGFKTATMIAPDHLRQYIFPYHKRLAQLAHARDKLYILHVCGNIEAVIDDLIDDVRIDAKHSFEDIIQPVEVFKAWYGDRVSAVGGIDIDLLCRATEEEVRARVRAVLDACMPAGYVLGTGNSVANYVPVRNFLAMVDEGHRWQG
ncbi:MAG: uroporphyrinogen-III decarboxylase-like protein [Anaerolineae bacterium]|nr:uroporphyrinogen-III decarboxylase-like protein [Anaerolineae bacterium]